MIFFNGPFADSLRHKTGEILRSTFNGQMMSHPDSSVVFIGLSCVVGLAVVTSKDFATPVGPYRTLP